MTRSVVGALADFCVEQRLTPLSHDVMQSAVKAVIDWTAGTLVGAKESPSLFITQALMPTCGGGPCQIVTSAERTDVRTAALINGTAAHVAEIDDIYRDGLYHPGAPTIAAALAMAQHLGSSGSEFLRAVVMGYEVGSRLARAINPEHYRFWHTTGTVGAIGSAAACAELLKLGRHQFADALATASTLAAGLQQAFRSDSMSKALHSGRAAETGAMAALTALHGFTGAHDIIEGSAGFAAAMADRQLNQQSLLGGLGESWCINSVTVKNHFCCGHTFAAVDAAIELRRSGLNVKEVASIEIHTYKTAIDVAGISQPATPFEAKFSIPYTVIMGLLMGSVRRAAFEIDAMTHPELIRILPLVKLAVDEKFESEYPKRRQARIKITDFAGRTFNAERNTRKGDPDDPLTNGEVAEKFLELVEPLLGGNAQGFLGRLKDLPSIGDINAIEWHTESLRG